MENSTENGRAQNRGGSSGSFRSWADNPQSTPDADSAENSPEAPLSGAARQSTHGEDRNGSERRGRPGGSDLEREAPALGAPAPIEGAARDARDFAIRAMTETQDNITALNRLFETCQDRQAALKRKQEKIRNQIESGVGSLEAKRRELAALIKEQAEWATSFRKALSEELQAQVRASSERAQRLLEETAGELRGKTEELGAAAESVETNARMLRREGNRIEELLSGQKETLAKQQQANKTYEKLVGRERQRVREAAALASILAIGILAQVAALTGHVETWVGYAGMIVLALLPVAAIGMHSLLAKLWKKRHSKKRR